MIQKAICDFLFVYTNVPHPSDCETLVKRTVEKNSHLDYACNYVGIGEERKLIIAIRTAAFAVV